MTTSTPPTTDLPEALLRATCEYLGLKFPGWPSSFEEVMADPMRRRLVEINAKHPPVPSTAVATPIQRPSLTARALPPLTPRGRLPQFDHKRAASGERDDD